jgi:hypothetical protein
MIAGISWGTNPADFVASAMGVRTTLLSEKGF